TDILAYFSLLLQKKIEGVKLTQQEIAAQRNKIVKHTEIYELKNNVEALIELAENPEIYIQDQNKEQKSYKAFINLICDLTEQRKNKLINLSPKEREQLLKEQQEKQAQIKIYKAQYNRTQEFVLNNNDQSSQAVGLINSITEILSTAFSIF